MFGRPADPTGLSYFNGVTKNGADLTAIGDLASTAEYKERFAGQTNSQIVNSIYKSLFNRDAEANGLKFFVDGLTNGTFNIKNIAIAILDGAQGSDLTIVNNKIAAANNFTKALDTTTEIESYKGTAAAVVGRNFLTNINADASSVPSISDTDKAILTLPPPAAPVPTLLGQSFTQEALTGVDVNSISDPLFKSQWYLKNNGDRGASAGLDVNIAGAWASGLTGRAFVLRSTMTVSTSTIPNSRAFC